jgi:hypothetical protein
MNRILRHVNSNDFRRVFHKKLSEENKLAEIKLKEWEEEENIRKELEELLEPLKVNWREELEKNDVFNEGMTTAGLVSITLPAEGDTDLETIDSTRPDSFNSAAGLDALNGVSIKPNGTGSGETGGFDIGQSYLGFDGSASSRHAILDPVDSSQFDTMSIRAIVGNDSNGGEDPDVAGEELRLYYMEPGGSSFKSITIDPRGDQILSADADIIIALGAGNGALQNFSISLPSYARGNGVTFMLYQASNSGRTKDHYGITNLNYQRRSPRNVFVSLDSPDASAFIRTDPIMKGLSAEERRKKLEDMLDASNEYMLKSLGMVQKKVEFSDTGAVNGAAAGTNQSWDDNEDSTSYDVTKDGISSFNPNSDSDPDSDSNFFKTFDTFNTTSTQKSLDPSLGTKSLPGTDGLANAIINDPTIKNTIKNLSTSAKTYLGYLTNQLPEVIDNDYLGQDYVNDSFKKAKINQQGTITVGDNIVGTGGEAYYDTETGEVKIPFNYDFKTNDQEFSDPSKAGVGDFEKAVLNVLGPYSADSQPNLGKNPLSSILGGIFGKTTEIAKGIGGAQFKPGEISMSVEKLKEINPALFAELDKKYNISLQGTIPELDNFIDKSIEKMGKDGLKSLSDKELSILKNNFSKIYDSYPTEVYSAVEEIVGDEAIGELMDTFVQQNVELNSLWDKFYSTEDEIKSYYDQIEKLKEKYNFSSNFDASIPVDSYDFGDDGYNKQKWIQNYYNGPVSLKGEEFEDAVGQNTEEMFDYIDKSGASFQEFQKIRSEIGFLNGDSGKNQSGQWTFPIDIITDIFDAVENGNTPEQFTGLSKDLVSFSYKFDELQNNPLFPKFGQTNTYDNEADYNTAVSLQQDYTVTMDAYKKSLEKFNELSDKFGTYNDEYNKLYAENKKKYDEKVAVGVKEYEELIKTIASSSIDNTKLLDGVDPLYDAITKETYESILSSILKDSIKSKEKSLSITPDKTSAAKIEKDATDSATLAAFQQQKKKKKGKGGEKDYGNVAASYPTPLDKVGGFKGVPKGKGWYPTDENGNPYNPQTGLPIKQAGKKQKSKGALVAHHEPIGKVLSEKKKLKSVGEVTNKIPGYYDGKPSVLGFPDNPPPEMVNGMHPDLVTPEGQKKQAKRYNRLDPQSARAMPPTANPYIDKIVRAAAKKPK